MMPGDQKEAIHSFDKKAIREGEMWGVNIGDFTEWVEENGDLNVKFIIYYVSHWFEITITLKRLPQNFLCEARLMLFGK